jgi:chromosomal replication initiator protein
MNAIRSASENHKSLEEFNNKYRSLDVLLIDDIQFLSGKERTEEAFFNIFNELQQNNKQIIISSDRPPKAIPGIEQRLVSRFEWGMIADIQTPDFETKVAIIQEKSKEKNFTLENDVVEYLANAIHNNIRELEGVLNKIIALSQLQNRVLNLNEVKQITSQIVVNTQKNSLVPKNIIKIVSEYFDISIEDVVGPCRKKNLTEPRQIIMFIMRDELKLSYPVIGQEVGGRDHTTVIHACDKIIRNLKTDDKLRQDINTLKQKLYI